jgi:hypothetical protein
MDSPEYLIDSDIRKLLSVIHDPRDQAVVVTILTTGLFLSELIAIDLESIDFDAKTLTIVGKRSRTVALTTTTIAALTKYLNIRPKTPEVGLFVTERGVPKRLSDRSVDHIIRSAAKAAELDVNYHALRNTFIVRSLQKTDAKTTAKLLGVDREALARFDAIIDPQSSPQAQRDADDPFDTRSPLGKLVDIIHPTKPPEHTEVSPVTPNQTVGRDRLLKKSIELIHNNQSILFTGLPGIGKTHLLEVLSKQLPNTIFISSPVPFKTMLLEFAKTICPDESFTQRTPTADILSSILTAESLISPILIIDNIDRLKASEEDTMIKLIDKFPIIAAAETTPARIQSLWWKFQKLPVPALDKDSTKQLTAQLTQGHSMDPGDFELLETKIVNLANGNPFAVGELISQLPVSKKVTADHIRKIDHEAGIVYRDWSWVLMALWTLLVISRFIALGSHSFEGYILAGMGTSIFVFFKYIVKLRR